MSLYQNMKIPPFLRRLEITEELLDETIATLILAGESLLADRLSKINPASDTITKPLFPVTEEGVEDNRVDTSSPQRKIRLTRVLKERVAHEIIAAVKNGHNTVSKLKKFVSHDDRVLKASIRYALNHRVANKSQLVKLSPKTYGVET
tara:strand:+ start:538 stop:981 length:444 start_codon:yes stop_codon:yes gene_type:complete